MQHYLLRVRMKAQLYRASFIKPSIVQFERGFQAPNDKAARRRKQEIERKERRAWGVFWVRTTLFKKVA